MQYNNNIQYTATIYAVTNIKVESEQRTSTTIMTYLFISNYACLFRIRYDVRARFDWG